MSDDDFAYDMTTLRIFFQPSNLALWVPALVLAVVLRVITHKYHHQLIFPICKPHFQRSGAALTVDLLRQISL